MNGDTRLGKRVQEVRRIFEEYGFGNAEFLAGWGGEHLEELADILTEEEFQTLLDELEDLDERRVS